MSRKKIATTVYITPQQDRELKALHARTKVPIAEYIRQGIDLILEENRRHLPGQLDLYRDSHEETEWTDGFRRAADERRR